MTHHVQKSLFFLSLFIIVAIGDACKKKDKSVPGPVITAVDPTAAIIGDPVSITGTNLTNASRVTFGGTTSTIIQNSANTVTTIVPEGVTAGTKSIVIETAGGSSNAFGFQVIALPEHIDSLPPTLNKTIPAGNFLGYPLLIYGDNLSGAITVTFNDKIATVITNNQKVITTTIPEDLASGQVTIKVRTMKGTATLPFQVQGPPPGGPPSLDFSIVDLPPPTYVPAISNNWTCGLFSQETDSTFVDLNSDPEFDNTYFINGIFEFDFSGDYNKMNYIEFTNDETGETFAGMFSSPSDNPCVLKMVLISSKTGEVSECSFDRRINDPDLVCDE